MHAFYSPTYPPGRYVQHAAVRHTGNESSIRDRVREAATAGCAVITSCGDCRYQSNLEFEGSPHPGGPENGFLNSGKLPERALDLLPFRLSKYENVGSK